MDIVTFQLNDLPDVLALYRTVTEALRKDGLHQWDRFYPNRFVIRSDIRSGCLYGIRDGSRVIAAVCVNDKMSTRYTDVQWADTGGSPAVIHRLAVDPSVQGKGLGRRLLQFAEHTARSGAFTSIRLDVCTANGAACALYDRYGYSRRGVIQFPFRKDFYYCMEKSMVSTPVIS